MKYLPRIIDVHLTAWASNPHRKPLLLRGARQVGKSWAVRHLGENFSSFLEINFEKNPEFKEIFRQNLDIGRIVSEISILTNKRIIDGETLMFFDEIQACPEAIMSLRFFKEERPGLHIIAAGSLLEFTLAEIPTFGVGRIHSIFMYPMTFDEFLMANEQDMLLEARDKASFEKPLSKAVHEKFIELFRLYILVGGMPEVVASWVRSHDYLTCQEIQNDIIIGYEDDFAKYRKKVNIELLRRVFHGTAYQITKKFTYADIGGGYKTYEVKEALDLLCKAGLLYTVGRTAANGFPLGGESDRNNFKILTLDPGLTLRLLDMTADDTLKMNQEILTSTASELVNKGPLAELIAGLEIMRYRNPNIKHNLYYWARDARNSLAEIDYIVNLDEKIVPIEIKAGTKGGMKSLWIFMNEKHLELAIRCSLENIGAFSRIDPAQPGEIRNVLIVPLYAVSRIGHLFSIYKS